MNTTDKRIIDAIIKKAERVCPDSLALIGLYGSAATGDTHEKSDLDLLILINDVQGRQLAEAFILNDSGIGYDIYCTNWEMLEEDANCNHAHLSKLLDSPLVYVKDQSAVQRLEKLKKKAADLLASDERYNRVRTAFEKAKIMYADCFLTDSVSQIRAGAGAAVSFLLDAVMLYHGRYFRKGTKRTFEELESLHLPFNIEKSIMDIIRAETGTEIRNKLTHLMRTTRSYLQFPNKKAAPDPGSISGTYEEMFSNWRNKMQEAVNREDLFSSFMSMVSFQFMLNELAENIAVHEFDIMGRFDPHRLEENLETFDNTLEEYLDEYRKAGIEPKCFANVDDFLAYYDSK